jgi:hypothetical protein
MGDWYSSRCALTWKLKGTKFSRLLFQLVPKTHRTEETDAGLLPTPTAMMDEAPIEKVDARNQKQMEKGNSPFILGLGQQAMRGMLPTPTVMDSANNGDMTAAAKLMQGATHRSSGQPIQKTLTMEIHQQILSDNQPLIQELANKPMLKRTNLPPQKEFVEWIRSVTNAKELSQMIDVKMSTAEHWFRTDAKGFSHPSIEEWTKIAEIFQVTEQMNARMMEQSSIEWTGLLPTPKAMEAPSASWENRNPNSKFKPGVTLTDLKVWGMLPTPRTSDERMHWRTENWKGDDLGSEINHLLGTRSHLNPRFVEEMMGFPPNWTASPFQSGEQNPSKDTATQ